MSCNQSTAAEDLHRYGSELRRAMETGGAVAALKWARLIRATIVTMPDSEIRAMSKLEWDRAAIESLVDDLQREANDEAAAAKNPNGTCGTINVCDLVY